MMHFKRADGSIYANDTGLKKHENDIKLKSSEVNRIFKEKQNEEKQRQEQESKIIESLGAKDKQDAIVKQLNLINEAIASGDNTKVKEVDSMVKSILK